MQTDLIRFIHVSWIRAMEVTINLIIIIYYFYIKSSKEMQVESKL